MRFEFLYAGSYGSAEYDSSTGEYTWSYEGDEDRIIGLLSDLEDGRVYGEMITGSEIDHDSETSVVGEEYVPLPWDQQIEKLEENIRQYGADTTELIE